MKYFRIKYADGNWIYERGKNSLEIIKKHDLCTREHINTRVIELSGEQELIARDYFNN